MRTHFLHTLLNPIRKPRLLDIPKHDPRALARSFANEVTGGLRTLIEAVLNPPFDPSDTRYLDFILYHAGAIDQGVAVLRLVTLHAPEHFHACDLSLVEALHGVSADLIGVVGLGDSDRSIGYRDIARLHHVTKAMSSLLDQRP